MFKAQLSFGDGHETSVMLGAGKNVFGTSLECDVILPKTAELDDVFIVTCTEEGTTVAVGKDVGLRLQRGGGEARSLSPAQPVKFSANDVLILRDVVISVHPTDPEFESLISHSPSKASARFRRTLFACSVPILCGAVYWSILNGVADASTSGVFRLSDALVVTTSNPERPREADEASVLATLGSRGFTPVEFRQTADGFQSTFYVSDHQQRDALLETLKTVQTRILPRIILDSALAEAAQLSMSLAQKEADDISVENGVLTVKGAPADETWRDDLIGMLNRDIPNLKEVRFVGQSSKWKSEMDDAVVAVWSGRNPYLLVSGGDQVRPGQEVVDGVRFVGFKDDQTLLISINDIQQEYPLQK